MSDKFHINEDDNADDAGGSGTAAEPLGAEEEAI